jgi:hypothetical protein
MNKLGKYYFREMRDQLGYYPNWPVSRRIGLGQIGYWDGRNAEFDWRTSLSNLNVSVGTLTSPSPVEECYTSKNNVQLSFKIESSGAATAHFNFTRRMSLACQGYQMNISSLDLGDLLLKLRDTVGRNKALWDWDWLIVTELWTGKAFTTLISGDGASEVAISASSPPPPPGSPFNVANPSFGLGVSRSKGMAYKVVAEQRPGSEISPFFHVHKLVDHPQKGLGLKKYAVDYGWFWG